MKYIKTYEAERLTVGKYVICVDNTLDRDDEDEKDAINFLSKNIGKLVKIEHKNGITGIVNDNDYCVYYENIPKNISYLFSDRINYIRGHRWFNKNEILFFASSKEELKIKIKANQYNL